MVPVLCQHRCVDAAPEACAASAHPQICASHVYTVLYYDPYICAHVKPTDIHL